MDKMRKKLNNPADFVADKDNKVNRPLLALGIIWLIGAVGDRIWFALDHSVPAWDQADYLTGLIGRLYNSPVV